MPNYILSEKQLSKISDNVKFEYNIREIETKWEGLSESQKKFIVDFLFEMYPRKKALIKEDKWYNTLGDVVGIFDPSGVVDLVNGISYLSQGDNLFGFLSIVSAVPYLGDAVAKPVMGALKVGAPSAKALEGVLKATKAAKTPEDIAKLSADLAKMSDQGGITGKFVQGMGYISQKLRSLIERVPNWPSKGLKGTILKWIDLFEGAAKTGKGARTAVSGVAKEYGTLSKSAKISSTDKLLLQSKLSQELDKIKSLPGAFTGYRTPKASFFSWKTAFGGLPQVMGRNRSVRQLMRQTKWWAGFLDWLGLGNFVGPDELAKQLGGEEQMSEKMKEYNKTAMAQNLYNQEFPDTKQNAAEDPDQETQPQQKTKEDPEKESFLKSLLKSVLLGPLKPLSN